MFAAFFAQIVNTFIAMAPYLLIGLFFSGILHVFINKDLIIRHLGGNTISSVVKAAVFGIPLPLCSCGVLPVAMSLRKQNASNGATVSFLISTPQTGIDSIVATWGMLGPVFAIFRPIAALVMGITGGLVTNLFSIKAQANDRDKPGKFECSVCYEVVPHSHTFLEKCKRIFTYAYRDFFDDISAHLALGVIISGAIGFIIPPDFFQKYVNNEFMSMLLMVVLGIPMYTCVTASIPVAVALMLKGLSPGAAFVFLTVGPATNFSFITVIAQVMGKKILTVYLATLAVLSIVAGFGLNAIFAITGKQSLTIMLTRHFCGHTALWENVLSGIFLIVLLLSFYRLVRPYGLRLMGKGGPDARRKDCCSIEIEGMTCKNCARNVTESLKKVDGVTEVNVDLGKKNAFVQGSTDVAALKKAVEAAGFTVKEKQS